MEDAVPDKLPRPKAPLWARLALATLAAAALALLVALANGLNTRDFNLEFLGYGGEPSYVAQSLLAGRGYSDPFGPSLPIGPTGWCLPAYVGWLVVIYATAGVGTPPTGVGFLVFDFLCLALTCGLLAQTARRHLGPRFTIPVVALFAVLLGCWIRRDGGGSSDKFFVMALNAALLEAHLAYSAAPGKRAWWGFAILGGLAGVVNVGSHFLALGLALSRLRPRLPSLRAAVPLLLCLALPSLVWSARHRIEMGGWSLPKTNGPHDLALNHVYASDGVLDASVFLLDHPYFTRETRERMARLGELAFMRERGERARQAILADPLEALRRVGNRARNALLHTRPGVNQVPLAWAPDPELGRRLIEAGLMAKTGISRETWSWLRLEMPADRVGVLFAQTGAVRDRDLVVSRASAMASFEEFAGTPFARFCGWAIAAPAALALALIVLRWKKAADTPRSLAIAYLLLIGPYVLVSHASSYQAYILPAQALLLAAAATCLPLARKAGEKSLASR